ncbi:MAG: hypothetical protein ACRCSV_00900 [Chlamydiales bacterium]
MTKNKQAMLPKQDEPSASTPREPDLFQETLTTLQDPIKRVRFCIDVMRESLSKPNYPAFVPFWEAKKCALESFKEISTPTVRCALWEEYIELAKEARNLNDILQEQNAFSIEQITLAVESLEKDFDEEEKKIALMDRIDFPKEGYILREQEKVYNQNQLQLNFIHAMISRIQTIRRELIAIPISIKYKVKLLQKLSQLGNRIFPRKKQMIQEMSTLFYEDVQRFNEKYFQATTTPQREKLPPLYLLKEEIKAFQKMAKVLSISSECFFSTRKLLSTCFETIKQKEKQRRQDYQEKKQKNQLEFESIYQEIQNFGKWITTESFSKKTYSEKLDEIYQNIEKIPFVHEQVKILRGELEKQQQLAEDKYLQKDPSHTSRNSSRREEVANFLNQYKTTVEKAIHMSIQELLDIHEESNKQSLTLTFNLEEEIEYQAAQVDLQTTILQKQHEAAWEITDPIEKAQSITDHLHKAFACKEEVKLHLESLRRLNSSSGLNFQQALLCRDCIQKARDHMEKINSSIEKLEEYLLELQV